LVVPKIIYTHAELTLETVMLIILKMPNQLNDKILAERLSKSLYFF